MPASLNRLASAACMALWGALLAGCSDGRDGDVVELRMRAPAFQAIYSSMFGGDSVDIRLHLYDRLPTSEGLSSRAVFSKKSIDFDIPKRVLMTNIISGPGDKEELAINLFLSDGNILLGGEAPPGASRELLSISIDSVSRSALSAYRNNVFLLLSDLASIGVPSGPGLRCRRGDAACVSQLISRLGVAERHCGFSILEYETSFSQSRSRAEASFPFSEGNVFIKLDEWPQKQFFYACYRSPASTICRWHGLFEDTYPISISSNSTDVCGQTEIRDKVIDWLNGHVVH